MDKLLVIKDAVLTAAGADIGPFRFITIHNDIDSPCGNPDCDNPEHYIVQELADDVTYIEHISNHANK